MERNYLSRVGKKERLLADGLYENITVALQDYPVLAGRLECEPVESAVKREMEQMMKRLTPIQRLQRRLTEDGDEGEGQQAG